jgi:uncharacterized membrane protein required for colicin V production
MGFLLTLALIVIFMACMGFLYPEGMWGNAVRLVNVLMAVLLAVNFWEPLAAMLENSVGKSFSYFWDFISLWALFIVFFVIFRIATGYASRVKVKFLGLADRIGSEFFAACIGFVLIAFTLMTLHTAPLKREFLFGGFEPGENMFLGMGPDKVWLNYMNYASRGPFSRWTSRPFDPNRQFIDKYATRRSNWDTFLSSSSKGVLGIRVPESQVPSRKGGGSS